MAANPFALPTYSQCRTPFFNSAVSGFDRSLSFRRKSTNTCLFVCCCDGAIATNEVHRSSSIPSDSGIMLLPLFKEIGFNEKDTETILKNSAALEHVPFGYLSNRIKLFQSAGLNGLVLSRLVAKRPDVLTAEEIDEFLHLIISEDDDLELKGKIELSQIERLLNSVHPSFLLGFEKKVRLLLRFGIPKEKIIKVLNTINLTKALCHKSLEEIERTLAFLDRFGGVDLILRRPATLNYDLESQLMPRIGFLFGLSGNDTQATTSFLHKFPIVLAYTVDHLKDHVDFLNSYAGLSYSEIFKITLVCPSLFTASRTRKLHPRIDFLKQCGLSPSELFKFLMKAPLFLTLSFSENLAYKLVFLVKIGYQYKTKDLAIAMGAVTRCSCKNLQKVIGVFLNYDLSSEDILDMSKKHPQVLQYNHRSLEEKLNYLIVDMGREVGELLSFPAYLGYKLDSRIKHRYEEKRKVLGEGMSINKLLSVSAARFSTKSRKESPLKAVDTMVEGGE